MATFVKTCSAPLAQTCTVAGRTFGETALKKFQPIAGLTRMGRLRFILGATNV